MFPSFSRTTEHFGLERLVGIFTCGGFVRVLKGLITAFFATVAFAAMAAPASAFEPYGIWTRRESGTSFDFYNCANKLCAKIVSVTKPEEKKVVGTNILRNAVKNADGEWHGELFNADDGKTYKGTVTIDSATELSLEGCLMKILCKTEKWQRSPDQSAASTPGGQPAMPAPPAKPGVGR